MKYHIKQIWYLSEMENERTSIALNHGIKYRPFGSKYIICQNLSKFIALLKAGEIEETT